MLWYMLDLKKKVLFMPLLIVVLTMILNSQDQNQESM